MSPALAGGFLTTGPPGKPRMSVLDTGGLCGLHFLCTPALLLCHPAPPWRHPDWSLPTVRRDVTVLSPSVSWLQSDSYHHY